MKSLFTALLLFFLGSTVSAQVLYYVSSNNRTGNWETASMWTKQEAWQANPPPPTAPLNVRTSVYGYVTRNGNLAFNGGDAVMDLYDTLVITGNLAMSQGGARHITVRSGGVLIVLGDFDAGNNNTPLIQVETGGRVVIVGDYDQQQGSITTNGPFYIYDDSPTFNNGSTVDGTAYNGSNGTAMGNSLEDETDLANNDPTLFNMVDALVNGPCGSAQVIASAQNICTSTTAALTGNAYTSATYLWESSTTSASTGFGNAAGTNNTQNYTTQALTQTTWFRRVRTKSGCSTTTSSAIQVRVLANGSWRGNSSAVWGTAANWCGSAVPTTTTDAFIPAGAANNPSISSAANVRVLTIESGAEVTVSSNTLNVFGALTNGGTITVNGTMNLSSTSSQTFTNNGTVTVGGTMTLNGTNTQTLTNSATGVVTATGTINFSGSGTQTLTNNGAFSAIANDNALMVFNGSGQQTVNGSNVVSTNNLTFNNASANQIIFQNDFTVRRGLTMTAGVVNLTSYTLSFGTGTANNAGGIGTFTAGNARFINGTFSRWIRNVNLSEANSVLFPMGTETDTRPIYIWVTSSTNTGSLAVRHVGSTLTTSGLSINDSGTPILRRQESFWDISSGNGMTQGTFSMKTGGTGFGVVTNLSHLRVMTTAGVVGTHNGADNSVFTSTTSNFLIERTGIGFTDLMNNNFHIGSITNSSSLPVTMTSFTGEWIDNAIELRWSTATEKNAQEFVIEHSLDGISFSPAGAVDAHGNSITPRDYTFYHYEARHGKNYYRIKTVDFDLSYEYSNLVRVDAENGTISVYPNPIVAGTFSIQTNELLTKVEKIELIDSSGRISFSLTPMNSNSIQLPSQAKPGLYLMRIFGNRQSRSIRVVVE